MDYAVLGPFELRGHSGQGRSAAMRERDLLALLALHAGQTLSVDRLVDALWGEDLPAKPANALQQRVLRVRRLLAAEGGPEALETAPGGYRLRADPEEVDALRFERARAQGVARLEAGDADGAAEALGRALAQWRGSALQDIGAPWAEAAARRLEELRLATLEDRLDADLARGRHEDVVGELEQLTAEHPLRDRLRGQQLRALALAGRQAEALEAYATHRAHLAEALGLDPSPALRQLHDDVLADRLTAPAPPPSRAPGRRAVTPPVPASTFVGREDERARLGELLAARRLVTLTGPGGTGKTRLALETLRTIEDRDLVFADLAAVEEPTELAPTVAAAAGLEGPPGATPEELLRAAFARGAALLVLDNCEHVRGAAGDLAAALVGACPSLTLLATSREPLGLDGEVVWPLETLPLPAHDVADLATATGSPAVRLLLDRAWAVDPGLVVGDADAPALVRIVRELDGLPLAIELAAARARVLTLPEIAERLADRFALLAGGRRDAPARHRALRATLEWSWDLLEPAEQRAWMAASVPVAPFDLDLLAVLLAAAGGPADPLEAVTTLRDRSLLRVEREDGSTRYAMLASLRAFAHERLAGSGLEPAVRDAHAAAVAGSLRAADRMTPQRWALDLPALRAWLPDARAAIRWRVTAGDRRAAQALAGGLGWLGHLTSESREVRRLLDEALGPLDGVDADGVDPVAALWAAGLRIADTGVEGLAWAELARARAGSVGDEQVRSLAAGFVAIYTVVTGRLEEGLTVMLTEAAGAEGWLAGVWSLLAGKVLALLGELEEAEAALDRAIDALDAAGAPTHLMTGDVLVHLAQLRGDLPRVRAAAARAITGCQRHDARLAELELRCLLAMAEAAADGRQRADAELTRARELAEGGGLAMVGAMLAQAEAFAALCAGDAATARSRWEDALGLHPWAGMTHGRPFALWGLGHLALRDGEVAAAVASFDDALAEAGQRGDRDGLATALEGLAAAALAGDEPATAAERLGAAEGLRAAMGAPEPLLTRAFAARAREDARSRLGASDYEAARARGATQPPEHLRPVGAGG